MATFYHHFDVEKEGEAGPAALTVRVYGGLLCDMKRAQDLLAKLLAILGREIRVIEAPGSNGMDVRFQNGMRMPQWAVVQIVEEGRVNWPYVQEFMQHAPLPRFRA